MNTPLLIFTYNRPQHTERLMRSLIANWRLGECELHFFSDGPKSEADVEPIGATRAVVRKWIKKFGGTLLEREKNLGLATSIVQETTAFCKSHGQVIVVEDDLLLRPGFIDFCLSSLTKYKDDERVWQVSGYLYPVPVSSRQDAIFLPMGSTWGWATWARAWKFFSWTPPGTEELFKNREKAIEFDLSRSFPYTQMLQDRMNGKNQSWGILWHWIVWSQKKLVAYPRETLVWNDGTDGSGVHAGHDSGFGTKPAAFITPQLESVFMLPNEITPDELTMRRIAQLFAAQDRNAKFPLSVRIQEKLKRFWP